LNYYRTTYPLFDLSIKTGVPLNQMSIKKVLLLVLFFFFVSFLTPKASKAIDLKETFTSENSIVVRIQEGVEYFFAFRIENKVAVLERQAEKRLTMAQNYAEEGKGERVQDLIQNYLQIKERQNGLLGKIEGGEVLGSVAERTIEQQKTIEGIKNKIDVDGKENVMQVQEKVVNQISERIVVVNGTEGQTEFLNKVEHVWAPGTGPGGTSGVIYEGGSKLMFAPGTSGGGSATNDIKTVEVKTGGVVESGLPAGVTPGDAGTTVDSLAPGTTNSSEGSGNDNGTWTIDP
jgi:hypothetical protein